MKMERKSSIEAEPKTLNFDQMHFARESALHVFNNKSIEEALNIFTEEESMKMERKSSIEAEPKTLNFDQMHFARESALHVFNNKSIEESLNIFTEGLEPIVDVQKDDVVMSYSEDVESYVDDCFAFVADTFQYHHDLPPMLSTTTDFGRDVVSAPF